MLKKIISFVLSFSLITSQPVFAQGVAQINLGNYLRTVGSSMAMDKFRPLHMRYFSYDALSDNFQLLLDKGDNKDIKEAELEEKTKVLMDYFKIGLSLPNEKFWVNLRPDAQDQIIDPELEKTDIGKIMLEADLQLKKDTAGLTSPQNPEGKLYWEKLYKKAGELFGSENITIPTITRPWIVPGEIILRQGEDSAYIFKANMKVMLEQDHLKGSQVYDFKDPRMKELNEYSSQLIRELIIPRLTKEVNTSKRYAALRQVFFSLVMARWFKDTFGSSGSAGASDNSYIKLIDSGDLTNLTSKESWSKTYYFSEYKKSFEKGEYNLKEEISTPTGQVIRSYISGGIVGSPIENNMAGYRSLLSTLERNLKIVDEICEALEIPDGDTTRREEVKKIVTFFKRNFNFFPAVKTVGSMLGMAFQDPKSRSAGEILMQFEGFIKSIAKEYKNGYFVKVNKSDDSGNMSIKLQPAGSFIEFSIKPEAEDMGVALKMLSEMRVDEICKEIGYDSLRYVEKIVDTFWKTRRIFPTVKQAEEIIGEAFQDKKSLTVSNVEAITKKYLSAMGETLENVGGMELPPANIYNSDNKKRTSSAINVLSNAIKGWMDNRSLKPEYGDKYGNYLIKAENILDLLNETDNEEAKYELQGVFEKLIDKRSFLKVYKSMKDVEGARLCIGPKGEILARVVFDFSGDKAKFTDFVTLDSADGNQRYIAAFALRIFLDEVMAMDKKYGVVVGKDIFDPLRFVCADVLELFLPLPDKVRDGGQPAAEEYYENNGSGYEYNEDSEEWKFTFGVNNFEEYMIKVHGKKFSLSSSAVEQPGGIDFRQMNYLVQPMGSFKDLQFGLPILTSSALERINLEEELEKLRDMVKNGMVPSGMRVKEYLAACFQKGKIEEKQDDLLVCLAEIYRLAEEENLETSPELRESLVIVDTGKFVLLPNNQKVGLN